MTRFFSFFIFLVLSTTIHSDSVRFPGGFLIDSRFPGWPAKTHAHKGRLIRAAPGNRLRRGHSGLAGRFPLALSLISKNKRVSVTHGIIPLLDGNAITKIHNIANRARIGFWTIPKGPRLGRKRAATERLIRPNSWGFWPHLALMSPITSQVRVRPPER